MFEFEADKIDPPVMDTYAADDVAWVMSTLRVFAGPAIPPAPLSPVPATCAIVEAAALADTAENPPIANAAAATSAMRLIDVFVDIDFLSIVADGTFPSAALR